MKKLRVAHQLNFSRSLHKDMNYSCNNQIKERGGQNQMFRDTGGGKGVR